MTTQNPITVAICSAGEIYGGVEEWILTFVREITIREPQIRVKVLLYFEGPLAEKLRAAGFTPDILLAAKYNPMIIQRTVQYFKENAVSVVHIHGYKASLIAAPAAKLCALKVIKTEHSIVEPMRSLRELGGHLRMYCNRALDTLATNLFTDEVIFVSEFVMRKLKKHFPFTRSRIIRNGIVPLEIKDASPEGIDPLDFNIGIIGRLSPVKGHKYLFEALKGLNHIPEIKLHIFGEGALRIELERLAHSLSIEKRVIFWGFQNNVSRFVRKMSLFVMPSIFESMPYSLLEAMYLGVPVIASNVGGIPEVIENGADGLLVPAQDPDALRAAIVRLFENKTERTEMAQKAETKVRTHFMIPHMLEEYTERYREGVRK
jgi:glycosyltransferase involved in cell wall biosynthesis